SNRWTQSEFNDWYTEQNIREFVSQNLTTSNGSLIESSLIGTISYDSINSSIQISPVVMYRFELISNTKNISIDNRGNILISGLTFFTSGKLVNLEDLVDAIQNIISTNRMTVEEFSKYVTDKQSQLKTTIRKNLYISNNSTISSDEIGEISLGNNNLVIELTPPANFKYVIDSSTTNVSLDVNTLSITGLEYYKINTLTNLNSFYNVVQQQILDEKWTVEEFKNYIDNNESEFKNKIITNISTTDGTPITLNEIGNISITNNNLTIELLVPENVRYEANLVTNTSLSNDVLTFSNFQYYTATNFTRLNDLVNAIQNVIDSNQFTNYDFRDYLESEYNSTFKQTVTNNLFVSANSTIAANQVQSVQFDNNNVVITLEIPGPNSKYTSDANSDVVLSNNTLIVGNLKYFSKVNITKLDVLHAAIQNKIDELSATNADFATYVQQNTSSIKSLVQQNLYISLNTTISLDQIISVTYDSGNLVVSLANPGERVKYVADIDQNISFANNSLTISGLKYFNTINLSNLNKLYVAIQDKIDSKLYTDSDFANYVNTNQDDLKQLVAENINVSSSATIDVDKIKSVAFANNQFTISLDSERLN
ncbi:MAG: hypothetical protein K2L64_01765, partial [Ureaplasma sp.]|nr:hypothetical protein [Ureaplasma sp.]